MKVWATVILASMIALSAESADSERDRTVQLADGVEARAGVDDLHLIVTAHRGDAWTRLARRITGDAMNWKALADLNQMDELLRADAAVRVPWSMVRRDLRIETVRLLFPGDARSERGWIHEVVLDREGEGESLWEIAKWFTGNGMNYSALLQANPGRPLSTRTGERVLIPSAILDEDFRKLSPSTDVAPARSRSPEALFARSSPEAESPLTYSKDGSFAVYQLKEGQAIYSSVAIRFTGRVHADDVNEAVDRLIAYNRIEDVSRMPVGYPVRIPRDLLTDQYQPRGDERRESWELARVRGSESRAVRALRLEGVHVIIDPGHGGRDVGASSGSMWESNYVYDIAARLRDSLERKSGATVWMTTHSPTLERSISSDVISGVNDHTLNTDPVYDLASPTVGVNLRWYLANAILARLVEQGVPRERVVFVSIHADSLHPSLSGAMAYIPGHRYVQGSFRKNDGVYLARREVRENPVSTLSLTDARIGESLSIDLAEKILSSMQKEGLRVHPYTAIRDHVVRKGEQWVPAVIRHNQVYSRVLLEVGNLGNPEDRTLLMTRSWREGVADAIFEGINRYFSSDQIESLPSIAAR